MYNTQYDKILAHLQKNKTMTSWEAITKYRITRLGAVIFQLKKDGYKIRSEMVYEPKTRYARYYWEED